MLTCFPSIDGAALQAAAPDRAVVSCNAAWLSTPSVAFTACSARQHMATSTFAHAGRSIGGALSNRRSHRSVASIVVSRTPRSRRAHRTTPVVGVLNFKSDGAKSGSGGGAERPVGRRELVLNGSGVFVLGGLLDGLVDNSRPAGLGLHQYGDVITLGLCPPRPNCISTAEDLNDDSHFIPPWTYNPQDGKGDRGIANPVSAKQAMEELVDVVTNTDCDGYTVSVVTRYDDYLYVEYKDPKLGFIDDVEFFFEPGNTSRVAYRSSARVGEKGGDVQRRRIKTLRVALTEKGWKSVGF